MKDDKIKIETEIKNASFISCEGIHLGGTLKKIEKSGERLSPIFEATSNALDAIESQNNQERGSINITFYFQEQSEESLPRSLSKIEIEDTGIGLTDEEFERMKRINDCSKSVLNKGSGRLQFVKFFASTIFESVFEDQKSTSKRARRVCELSASPDFLAKNAIIKASEPKEVKQEEKTGTIVRFSEILTREDRNYYEQITIDELKERLISHFFLRFSQEENLPTITLIFKIGEKEVREQITKEDIPAPHKKNTFYVPYRRPSLTEQGILRWSSTGRAEEFKLSVFLLPENSLNKNQEYFVSRGETVLDAGLKLAKREEKLEGKHYFIAITGSFIDNNVSDARGSLDILSEEEVKRALTAPKMLWEEEAEDYITFESIQAEARTVCEEALPDLIKRKEKQRELVESICERFGISKLIGSKALKRLTLEDGRKKIFRSLYRLEATDVATKDEALDARANEILALDPKKPEYEENLRELTDKFFQTTPEENRAALAHYFARRKLVFEILESILERKLEVQKESVRNEDEKLIHDVLFRQGTSNPQQSDLWLLNEEFVYYSGTSDIPLKDVTYKGEKLITDLSECSEEDREYLTSGGENRTLKRPDILIFPEDGKCVIIELKRPDVNISECLLQVNKYAALIYEYCALNHKIDRFYTYIIGENLNFKDVRAADSSYKPAPNFGYLYGMRFVPVDGKPDAEQYMEAHSYSTLLKRAIFRNKTFFDLLFLKEDDL